MPPSLRPSLLSLPPSLRTSLYRTQQTRSFSASQNLQSSPIQDAILHYPTLLLDTLKSSPIQDAILHYPTLLLDTLHSTGKSHARLPPNTLSNPLHSGLPWHTAIPLSALLVRGLLTYNLTALPARKSAIVRTNLIPLALSRTRTELSAYDQRLRIRNTIRAETNRLGKLDVLLFRVKLLFMKYWLSIKSTHKTGKEFGAPALVFWRSALNLGVFVAMTEAVRVKCGAREGLLAVILSPFRTVTAEESAEAARRAGMSSEEILVERLQAAREASKTASTTGGEAAALDTPSVTEPSNLLLADATTTTTTTTTPLPPLNTNLYAPSLDPTLRTEGLSWCPDLTLADPTLTLPALLGFTMILRTLLRPNTNPPLPPRRLPSQKINPSDPMATLTALPPKQGLLDRLTRGQRIGMSFSIVLVAVVAKLPAAVLLYMVPSMVFTWLQGRWLDWKYPLPEVIKPCRRPVRIKVRKEFNDG
jgi:inner membrane protein COX18